MSKLIYSQTLAGFNTAFPDKNVIDKSLVFIDEGYFWTHGRLFNLYQHGSNILDFTKSGNTVTVKDQHGNPAGSFEIGVDTITGDDIITPIDTKGAVTLSHKAPFTVDQTLGPAANSATTIVVPQIVFDKFGHLKSSVNRTATLNHVLGTNVDTSSTAHFLTGSATSATNTNSLVKTSKISFIPSTGELRALKFTENGSNLSELYAPLSHTTVVGDGTTLGHVRLSDSIESSLGVGGGTAATPAAVKAVYDYAKSIIAAGDAMIFKGTIGTGGTITGASDVNGKTLSTLTEYNPGWTFKIAVAQTIAGIGVLEIGDMIMAVEAKGTVYNARHWTAVQANIDGSVTATNDLTNGQLVVGAGTKNVKTFGSGTNGQYLTTVGGKPSWTSITYNTLGLLNGSTVLGNYAPSGTSAIKSLSAGSGITASVSNGIVTFNHSNTTPAQTTSAVRSFTYDANGHITGSTVVTSLPTEQKLTFSSGGTETATFDGSVPVNIKFLPNTGDVRVTTAKTGNDLTYTLGLTHRYRPFGYATTSGGTVTNNALTNTANTQLTIVPGNANVTMAWVSNQLRISAQDTWRDVKAYSPAGSVISIDSLGVKPLNFGEEFLWVGDELKIGWAEVSSTGTITYTT